MPKSFTKDQHAIAKAKKKALFSACIDGKYTGSKTGKYEHYGPADLRAARIAFFFSLYVVQQAMSPEAAFERVMKLVDELQPTDAKSKQQELP